MRSTIVALLGFALLGWGCATTDTVVAAKGAGTVRMYEQAYERVFEAARAAAKAKHLEIVEEDQRAGRLVLAHGVTLWSWGERIAVFVSAATPKTTRVEIISKPVLAPLNFPPDWEKILLEQIGQELARKN